MEYDEENDKPHPFETIALNKMMKMLRCLKEDARLSVVVNWGKTALIPIHLHCLKVTYNGLGFFLENVTHVKGEMSKINI